MLRDWLGGKSASLWDTNLDQYGWVGYLILADDNEMVADSEEVLQEVVK